MRDNYCAYPPVVMRRALNQVDANYTDWCRLHPVSTAAIHPKAELNKHVQFMQQQASALVGGTSTLPITSVSLLTLILAYIA